MIKISNVKKENLMHANPCKQLLNSRVCSITESKVERQESVSGTL